MRFVYLQILILTTGTAFSQTTCDKYSIDYVPKNLTDAINYLDCRWTEKDKEEFKIIDENDAVAELHMGTGQGIRNNWGLWEGKKSLYRYFRTKGISHPDDMSSIILTSFHRHLNNKPIDLDGQINYYKNYWKKAREKYYQENRILTEKKKKEYDSYHKGDTVKIEFKLHTKQAYPQIYPVQGHPDLNEKPDCYVIGIVTGKHVRKGTNYTLKIRPIDICGYQKIFWGSIHEKHGDFQVGQEYNFFGLTGFKISKQ